MLGVCGCMFCCDVWLFVFCFGTSFFLMFIPRVLLGCFVFFLLSVIGGWWLHLVFVGFPILVIGVSWS